MKTLFVSFCSLIFCLLTGIPSVTAQAPDLGSIASFVLFTSEGALGNTGTSHVNGNIGTNLGAITGFDPPTVVNGNIESANAITLQAKMDLESAYQQLFNTAPTSTTHAPVFGLGETLIAGVYSIAAAGSLGGNLILNAQGNPDAVFIFKFGGAFTTGAGSSVTLINGAQASNVFWIAEGEIAMAAQTAMKGTLIAHNGAISMGAGGTLVGRMLSTVGAATIYASRISLTPFPYLNPGEIPNLGAAANFAIFTSVGDVTNTGISLITGDIGTDVGTVTGYGTSTVNGSIETNNSTTAQATIDLDAAYVQLYNTPPTSTDHTPAYGSGETLFAGVYSIAAAGSLGGNLILDADGNANAVFIFRFGAAFTTGATSSVTLINGASACNVFWVAEGAISMAANTAMQGTLIANNGAISMGAGGTLEGRMLSTAGAASTYENTIAIPSCSFALPINSLSFTGTCDKQKVVLNWNTSLETNTNYFSVERRTDGINWQVVGTVDAIGNNSTVQHYSITDLQPNNHLSIYRLKESDFNGNFIYHNEVTLKDCGTPMSPLSIYPNPSIGIFNLLLTDNTKQIYFIEIFNAQGQKIYGTTEFQSKFDLSNNEPGVYFMNVQLKSKLINLKFIVN